MKSKTALAPLTRNFFITGTGDVGQALASAPPIVHAAEPEYALEEALSHSQGRHGPTPHPLLKDDTILRAAAATSADRTILPDDVFLAVSDDGAVVGPLRTPDNDELWRGRRSELRASICADDHSGGQRQSYTLSIYHLVPGDPDVSRQSHLREHELLAFLGSTLKVDRTKLQPDGMGLMLLAAHGLELVAGLKSFQIRENEETEEARHSFEGLTRSEHLAQVSDELYRAGIVSKSQALAAYREMQMLEEAQTATPTYLIGGGVHNLVDVGLRPPPG